MSEKVTYDQGLDYIADRLSEFFKSEPKKAIYWLMTDNPNLGGVVPAWLALSRPNGMQKLCQLIKDATEGNIP